MKRIFLLILLLLLTPGLWAVKFCPSCNYRVKSATLQCPKCLKMLKWPYAPPRTHQARVIVRTGKDTFIRHPRSQNRAWKADKNAGADLSGQIGSWGFLTGLRYLVCFDIRKSFAEAGVDLATFLPRRVRLRLVVADKQINQQIPVRVYPLSRPFQEGSGRFHIRSKIADGATWQESAPMLSWHIPGGDYAQEPAATGILGYQQQQECMIDVTAIYRQLFEEYRQTGIWSNPGLIIMRDPLTPCTCTFLSIYSFESKTRAGQILAPQLFFE